MQDTTLLFKEKEGTNEINFQDIFIQPNIDKVLSIV